MSLAGSTDQLNWKFCNSFVTFFLPFDKKRNSSHQISEPPFQVNGSGSIFSSSKQTIFYSRCWRINIKRAQPLKLSEQYLILHLKPCCGTQWWHTESAHPAFEKLQNRGRVVFRGWLVVSWRRSKVKLGGTQGSMGGGGRRGGQPLVGTGKRR